MSKLEKIGALVQNAGTDAVLLTSMSNLFYVTNCHMEGMCIVTAKGEGYAFTDSRYTELLQQAVAGTGWKVFEPEGRNYFAAFKDFVAEHGVKKVSYEADTIRHAEYLGYEAAGAEMIPLDGGLSSVRRIKSQEEIDSIVKAQRIAEAGLDELMNFIKPGVTDFQITARMKYVMTGLGDEGGFYSVLVGPISSMPHGNACGRTVQEGDFVLMDFGARYHGYISDMTRTLAVGYATDEMAEVYDIVKRSQDAGEAAMKVGANGREVHLAALNVVKATKYADYAFTYGLGHGVGVDVHEEPWMGLPREKQILQTGMIVTNEPGIYIPGKFGVRIEDMIWLSPEGSKNVTLARKDLVVLK